MPNNTFQIRIGTTEAIARNGTGTEGSNIVTFPITSSYKTTASNIVSSARNSQAKFVGSAVRMGLRRIDISWRVLSLADYSKMAKFYNTYLTFFVYYYDQDDNEWQVREMYVDNRVADAFKGEAWQPSNRGGGIEPTRIENYKNALIEV